MFLITSLEWEKVNYRYLMNGVNFCLDTFISGPKSGKKNKKHIFISYAWSEKDIVYKLKDRLKVGGNTYQK